MISTKHVLSTMTLLSFFALLGGCGPSPNTTTSEATPTPQEQASPTPQSAQHDTAVTTSAQAGQTSATTAAATPTATPAAPQQASITEPDAKVAYDFVGSFANAQFAKAEKWEGKVAPWQPTINGAKYKGILMHAPAKATYPGIKIEENSVLEFAPIIDPAYHNGNDGTLFIVTITPEGGEPVKVYERELAPNTKEEDKNLVKTEVPLYRFAGKTVDIQFATDNKPRKTLFNDMGVYVDPKIVIKAGVQPTQPEPAATEAAPKAEENKPAAEAPAAKGKKESQATANTKAKSEGEAKSATKASAKKQNRKKSKKQD